jgi:hypothetical protein
MRTSLILATFFVAGAGAVSAGATFATQVFRGSDTLYDLTNSAISSTQANLGNSGDYAGGGSGAGESAMAAAAPTQWMAPMSKMMTSTTCSSELGPTRASGIVIGLDAVDVYSSSFSGANPSNACSNQATATILCSADSTPCAAGAQVNSACGAGGKCEVQLYCSSQPSQACPFPSSTTATACTNAGTGVAGTCSLQGNSGLGLAYDTSIAYTDIFGNAQTLKFKNWTDVLALLYGGLDKSASSGSGNTAVGYSDCNSPQRRALAANWANLFEANGNGSSGNSCSTNPSSACTTASYHVGSASITFNGQLRHAFRRDDASGTSDAFAGIIGLGSLYTVNTAGPAAAGPVLTKTNSSGVLSAISYSVSASAAGGFGATPYCNAMNWDTTADSETAAGLHCQAGANKLLVGPGGVPQLFCGATACASGSTTATACSGGGFCTWDGQHKRPPAGTWGDVSYVTPASKNIGYDVTSTAYQDNDPIRRQCVGLSSLFGVTQPAEEVCNTDNPLGPGSGTGGQLGLVLPMAEVDWITATGSTNCNGAQCPTAAIYPTTVCTQFGYGAEMQAFSCATSSPIRKNNVCPSGANPNGGCQIPLNAAGSSFCENNPVKWPGIDPIQNDGRIYNLYVYDGTATGGPVSYNVPATTDTLSFSGAFARVHMTLPIWDHGASASPPNLPGTTQPQTKCQQLDMTDQIACLAQADPCSVGYAGDGGKQWNTRAVPALASAGSDAVQVSEVYPTTLGVQNGSYPFWRKLYYNSSNGFDAINGNTTFSSTLGPNPDYGLAELALGQYESNTTSITGLLSTFKFFALDNSPNGGGANPYCEDFNENTICSATTFPTNVNACANNSAALTVAQNTAGVSVGSAGQSGAVQNVAGSSNIPSDPSSVAANSTTSTVCGNGKIEPFEDCDVALTPSTCSTTCRIKLP